MSIGSCSPKNLCGIYKTVDLDFFRTVDHKSSAPALTAGFHDFTLESATEL